MTKPEYRAPEIFRSFKNMRTLIFRPAAEGDLRFSVLTEARAAMDDGLCERVEIHAFGIRWVWPRRTKKKVIR